MILKKGDFVEIDYVGRIKETNQIFDLTIEEIAKKNKVYNEKIKYKSIVICLGHNDVVKGLDEELIGKKIGEYTIDIIPEKAFGKKRTDLIKLVPTSAFTKQKIKPIPSLQVNMGGVLGVIKTVSGGRTLVDFNHPLAGKTLVYEIKINKIIKDTKEKLQSFLNLAIPNTEFELENDKVIIKSDLQKEVKDKLSKEIKERIPEIKKVEFKKATTRE